MTDWKALRMKKSKSPAIYIRTARLLPLLLIGVLSKRLPAVGGGLLMTEGTQP